MAKVRIKKVPAMQTGGPIASQGINDVAQLYHSNGMTQWQGQGIDFRSPDPGYQAQMPMPVPFIQKPFMPSIDHGYYTGYGQGSGQGVLPGKVGKGGEGDVFGNAHGPFQFGGTRKTSRIRITGIPSMNKQMATGGYADKGASRGYGNQQGNDSFALNRYWNTPQGYPNVSGQPQPFESTGRTLPEAEVQTPNTINIEKQEVVLGDFDQDGNQETMKADAPPHTEGGMDVNIPPDSFVFRDTKALKIKDPEILKIFNMPAKKGGYTPAQIASKYDLNKFKGIIQNPQSDDVSRSTAQLMSDNYTKKLNALAAIQEGMKKMKGIDQNTPVDQPVAQYGGPQSMVVTGTNLDDMYAPATSYYPPDPYRQPQGTQWSTDRLMQGAKGIGYPDNPNGIGFGQWLNLHRPEIVANVNQQLGIPNTYTEQNPIGSEWGKRHELAIQMANEHQLPNIDVQRPQVTGNPLVQDPYNYSTVPTPTPIAPFPAKGALVAEKGKDKRGWKGLPVMNPNTLGDALNLLQMTQVKKFQPYEPAPNAVIPDTVFLDPTRALAATQEAANSGMQADSNSANARAARAVGLARQGQAGEQVANILGQYNNQNVQIANAANAQAAQITNQLMAQQANRLAELNKANFLSDRDYKREMGKLQAEYVDRLQQHHNQAVNTQWLNKTSPYFNIDPITQMPVFKSEDAKAKYLSTVYNGQGDSAGSATKWKKDYDALVASGIPEDIAKERANALNGWDNKTHKKYDKNSNLQGYSVTEQYGGFPFYYQVGGDFPGVAPVMSPYEQGYPVQVADNTAVQRPQYTRPAKGDIATATNNPGNMKWSPWMRKVGGVPSGIPGKDGGQFAAFPDLDTGLHAYQSQLFGAVDGIRSSKYYTANTPVDKALRTWSNNGYGADIYPQVKGKTLGELTQAERDELMKRQIRAESASMYKLLKARNVF